MKVSPLLAAVSTTVAGAPRPLSARRPGAVLAEQCQPLPQGLDRRDYGRPGVRQATLRATNLALVTRHVFAAPEPVSRADVVLGGHLAPLAEALRPALEEELEHRVLASKWTPVAVLAAPDDEAPGATGAAWSLLEEVVADPAIWT